MKKAIWRSAPQAILILVIVAVGASIVVKELGLSVPSKSGAAAAKAPGGNGTTSRAGAAAQSGGSASPQGGANGQPGGAAARALPVRCKTITLGTIEDFTKLNGDVVSGNETKLYASVAGKLIERRVAVGSTVAKGTVIALVDPSKVGESYLPNPVESTVAGTVLSIPVSQGDTISTNTVIATIGNLSNLKVSVAVPERFLANLRIGSRAEVRFDAIPDAVYGAKVVEMSPVLDSASRTLDVKLGLDRGDPRILAGMFATVRLETDSRKNVLVVPRSAVGITSTEAYVFVVKADETVERRTVTLGIETEDAFEVRKGIAPGEKVVTEGRSMLSSGDRVRIVDGEGGAGARP